MAGMRTGESWRKGVAIILPLRCNREFEIGLDSLLDDGLRQQESVVVSIVASILHASRTLREAGIGDQEQQEICDGLIKQCKKLLFNPQTGKLILQLSKQDRRYFSECVKKADLSNISCKSNAFLKKHRISQP